MTETNKLICVDDENDSSVYTNYRWIGEVPFICAYNYTLLHNHKKKVGCMKFAYIFDLYNRCSGDSDKIDMRIYFRKNGIDKNILSREIMHINNNYKMNSLDMKPLPIFSFGEDYQLTKLKGFYLTDNFDTELLNIISETLINMLTSDIKTRYNLLYGNSVSHKNIMEVVNGKNVRVS